MLRTSSLAGGGASIAQAVFLEDTQGTDVTIYGRRYLQSGYIEDDASKFDTDIFTGSGVYNLTAQTSGFSGAIDDFASNGSQFVAVGRPNQISTSPDGASWTVRAAHTFPSAITGVAFGAGVFVAVGFSAVINSSTDGITWTNRSNSFVGTIEHVDFSNGLFIAVGGTAAESSPDGITWTQLTLGTAISPKSVGYGAGLHVMVGGSGLIKTSPDGVAWTDRASGVTSTINDITFGNGVFVATTQSDGIVISPDGINWTATGELLFILRPVAFGNGVFVVRGISTQFYQSQTGEDWELIPNSLPNGNSYALIIDSVLGGLVDDGDFNIHTYDVGNYAGSTVAHAENGENQYIRIT